MTTIYTTAASITKLVADVPKILKSTVTSAVLGNKDISKTIIGEAMYGFNYAAGTKYFNYGRDQYINGLPAARMVREVADEVNLTDLVTDAINYDFLVKHPELIDEEAPENVPIAFAENVRMTLPSRLDLMIWFLQESPDWSLPSLHTQAYNVFTQVATGNKYQFGYSKITFDRSNLYLDLAPADVNPTLPRLELIVPLNYDPYDSWIISARYSYSGVRYAWLYAPQSGRFPYLTFGFGTLNSTGYFPVVPIRLDHDNIIALPDKEDLINSSKQLLSRINIDLNEFTAGLVDPDDPTAIDSVSNAYVMFAANLNAETLIEKRYVYEFFASLYQTQKDEQSDWIALNDALGPDLSSGIGNRNKLQIRDRWSVDTGFDMTIWFNFITIETKSGNIGDPQPAYDPNDLKEYIGSSFEDATDISINVTTGTEYSTVLTTPNNETYFYNTHLLIIRKQTSQTTFMELVVHGLQHELYIDDRAEKINTNVTDIAQGKFFIPVSKAISGVFSSTDEALIYYETLIFLAYAVNVQKLKWYEEPAFFEVLRFVGVVFAVVDGGFTAAFTEGILGLIAYAAEMYLITAIATEVIKQVIDLVGGDVALVLATIAVAVAFYKGKGAEVTDFLDADTLLKYATLSLQAINTNIQDDILDLQKEQEDFLKSAEEWQEEIDAANELLDTGGDVDIFTLLHPNMYTDYTETPEEFYNRSIHMSNPGVMTLDVVENFADNALALPKAQTN